MYMKIFQFISFLFICCSALNASAQVPQGIPYQAVARNSSGAVLASTPISVRFTIRDSVATGAIKYRETLSVTTTPQGMFSVNVGQGTPVTGTFAGIDWGTNSKFMQVEMDPAGGSLFVDMGTTQMMSVPYAVHAGNGLPTGAEGDLLYHNGTDWVTFGGGSTGSVLNYCGGRPVWISSISGPNAICVSSTGTYSYEGGAGYWISSNASVAAVDSVSGIVTGIIAGSSTITFSLLSGCYVTKQITIYPVSSPGVIVGASSVNVGSSIALSHLTAGGLWSSSNTSVATVGSTGLVSGVSAGSVTISYSISTSCGSVVATKLVNVSSTSYSIGMSYGGGKIAYILQPWDSGYVAGETHGIIAAPYDQGSAQWGCLGYLVGVSSHSVGSGSYNTAVITATCGPGTAAHVCSNLVLGGYDDWYLPSQNELQKLYANRELIGGFDMGASYWSSTEQNNPYDTYEGFRAYFIAFYLGYATTFTDKDSNYNVRAIRSF